jgi:MFS family permease
VIAVAFHPRTAHVHHAVDYLGAALLAGGLSGIVLFTSLGGTTYGWGDPRLDAMLVVGIMLLVAFVFVERRAQEPVLPLELFRNRTFSVTSAIGFIIGLALFGAITFLPLYLQVVKGQKPTYSGLLLTPMMAGLLVTSIVGGQLISRSGRYRPFPIVGTALSSIALLLLTTITVDTPIARIALFMVVLGLGLGMVMQVLVLAVQNAVDYRYLGVATSGSTLFRQVGGSIGVSLFGAIFANQLGSELTSRLPPGARPPATATPGIVDRLPDAVRAPYLDAFAAALQPVFFVAAGAGVLAFALTWFLQEIPLRQTAAAEELGESSASAPGGGSLRELQHSLSSLASKEKRWETYEQFAASAGIDLTPPELWLLARIGEQEPFDEEVLEHGSGAGILRRALGGLRDRALVTGDDGRLRLTAAGAEIRGRAHAERCSRLDELLNGWAPEQHDQIRRMVDELARSFAADVPRPQPS